MANFRIPTKKILSEQNISKIIMLGVGLRDELNNMELGLISDYDNTKTYTRGQAVYYNNYLYKCLYTTTGDFDESKWQLIGDNLSLVTKQDIEAMLGLTQEEIASLQSLISTEIRLDKCFSSSDAYNRILNAENECKKFTLEQLAKKAGVVYKVVADTTGVDSTEFLYLISNGSNGYNIYAYIDGSAVKISDTNINLDNYAKLSDLDNFVKKTDADGEYATITTVDGKVDKTSILSAISSTPSNDKLLSEKAIKTELDKKAGTDKISHVSKYVCADSPIINDTMYRLYIGNDNVRFQKFIDFATSNRRVEWDYSMFNKDYGLFSQALGEGKDLNDLHMNCFFTTNGKCLNIPDIDKNFFGISLCYNGANAYSTQICVYANENQNTTKQRTIYVRHCYNGTWGNWGTISSTSVKDVPKTKITSESENDVDGRIYYIIKNGICFVHFKNINLKKVGQQILVCSNMPTSSMFVSSSLIKASNGGEQCGFAYIEENSSVLKVHSYEVFNNSYGSFSYPVAES